MSVMQIDNPLIENYLAQFDCFSPEEQQIVFSKLGIKQTVAEAAICNDDWPTPTDEQLEKMYTLCRGCLGGMTQERFDQLRTERIMGGK